LLSQKTLLNEYRTETNWRHAFIVNFVNLASLIGAYGMQICPRRM